MVLDLPCSSEIFASCIARLTPQEFEEAKIKGYVPYFFYISKSGGTELCTDCNCNQDYIRETAFINAAGDATSGILMLPWDPEAQTFQLRDPRNYTTAGPIWMPLERLIADIYMRPEHFESNGSARFTFINLVPNRSINIRELLTAS